MLHTRPLRLAVQSPGVPEIFRSIQGEGRSMGRVRTFVRLSGCNLHCTWCDTAYTWNWRDRPMPHVRDVPGAPHSFERAEEELLLGVAETAERIVALGSEGVVITGGEPLGQMAGVEALVTAIRERQPGAAIEVETNGTVIPSGLLRTEVDLFMVSPKLAHAGVEQRMAIRPDAIAAFRDLPSASFKFVARDAADVAAVAALAHAHAIPAARIYVMPEGTDAATLDGVGRAIVEAVIAEGFAYSDRLHVRLFGDARGV